MADAMVALLAGLLGAVFGLAGTLITLRHERQLERQRWICQQSVEVVSEFLAQLNELWQWVDNGRPLNADDCPWVACANSCDKALMVVVDVPTLQSLARLRESILKIRWETANDLIWHDEIWPEMRKVMNHQRGTLSTSIMPGIADIAVD